MYCAHDVRYLFELYTHLVAPLEAAAWWDPGAQESWLARVEVASDLRGRWWEASAYTAPSAEAPDF